MGIEIKWRVLSVYEIKFSYKIIDKITDKMFANPKNLSHHQAFESLQSLFPSITLPTFSYSNSLRTILDVLHL
jgi:hypothetical protein